MNFSRKHLRLAAGLLGALFVGGVLAGCGNEAKSDEIKIGANFEMTGNVANYGAATLDGRETVIGTTMLLIGDNSRTAAQRVAAKLEEIGRSLPDATKSRTVRSRSAAPTPQLAP